MNQYTHTKGILESTIATGCSLTVKKFDQYPPTGAYEFIKLTQEDAKYILNNVAINAYLHNMMNESE